MHDATDHATIIDPRLAAPAGRQVGRNLRELRIRQPEEVPTHWWPPEEVLNHESAAHQTPLWVRTLGRWVWVDCYISLLRSMYCTVVVWRGPKFRCLTCELHLHQFFTPRAAYQSSFAPTRHGRLHS